MIARIIQPVTLLLILAILLSGCAHQPDSNAEQQARIDALAIELQTLSPDANQQDAYHLARVAVQTSANLREQYGVTMAPWLHNIEVNSGIKPRGLCFQYANDLAVAIKPLTKPYWQLHYVQARPDKVLEHNAVVITGGGSPWQSGIVLDGWRNAGVLYFGPVTKDKYPWQLKNKFPETSAVTTSDHQGS